MNLKKALKSKKIEIVDGDITDKKLVFLITKNVDFLFHFAAIRITQCAEEPRLAHDVLATGTLNLLEAAIKNKIKKINSPILIMHGKKDNIVPQIMGLELFEKANNPKFSYFPDNDDHMMEYNEELLSKIKNFINKL